MLLPFLRPPQAGEAFAEVLELVGQRIIRALECQRQEPRVIGLLKRLPDPSCCFIGPNFRTGRAYPGLASSVRADELAALYVLADHRMPAAQSQLARSLFRRLATIHQGTDDPATGRMVACMHTGLVRRVVT